MKRFLIYFVGVLLCALLDAFCVPQIIATANVLLDVKIVYLITANAMIIMTSWTVDELEK